MVPFDHKGVDDGSSCWVAHSDTMVLAVDSVLETEVVVLEDVLCHSCVDFCWDLCGGSVYDLCYAFCCFSLVDGCVECCDVEGG